MERNGIDLDILEAVTDGIREDRRSGAVSVRIRHRWEDGFHVEGAFEALELAGHEYTRAHRQTTDLPAPFGDDRGPTPGGEAVLGALGACVATTTALNAARRGIDLDALEVVVESDLNLSGLFEVGDGRPFPADTRVTVHVESDADDDAIAELVRATGRTSPVVDALTNPTPVAIAVERRERSAA